MSGKHMLIGLFTIQYREFRILYFCCFRAWLIDKLPNDCECVACIHDRYSWNKHKKDYFNEKLSKLPKHSKHSKHSKLSKVQV